MKNTLLFRKASALMFWSFVMLFMLAPGKGFGQTYYPMSSGNYSETFIAWSGYSTNWNGLAILATGSVPVATKTTVASNGTLAVVGTSGAIGYDVTSSTKLVFLTTGTTDNAAAIACDLNLNFIGRNAGNLTFDYALVANTLVATGRASSLLVYYSTDGTTWTSLGGPYTVYNTIGSSTAAVPVNIALPGALSNQGTVKFRFYEYNGGTVIGTPGGNRPKISVDNVGVSSTAALTTPTVTNTTPPINITATSATLEGNVTATGGSSVLGTGSVYSTSPAPAIGGGGVTQLATSSPNAGTGTFSNGTVSLLAVNTQYYYNAYANNAQGTVYGTASSFYTLANVPSAPTVGGATSSSLNVAITSGDGNPGATTYAIEVGTGNYVQTATSSVLGGTPVYKTTAQWGTTTVTGLTDNTSYSFRVYARNGANVSTTFGAATSVSTLENSSPSFTPGLLASFSGVCKDATSSANSFSLIGANLTGSDVTIGPLTGYTFDNGGGYGNTVVISGYGTSISTTINVKFTPTAVQSYDGNIPVNGGGASNTVAVTGSGVNTAPSVSTGASSNVFSTTATITGSTTAGCTAITASGFVYGLASDLSGSTTTTTSIPSNLTGLSPNTIYYYRAYATDDAGARTTNAPSILNFTTTAIGTITALPATNPTGNSFDANWGTVDGADGYRLDVSTSSMFGIDVPTPNFPVVNNTGVVGTSGWTETNVIQAGGGSPYLELIQATSSVITPTMDLSTFSGTTLNFKARTFGGTNVTNNIITVSISTDNGATFPTTLGTRQPLNSTLNPMTFFDLSAYTGTQVKIKFQTLSANGSIGVGLDDIIVSGTKNIFTPSFVTDYNDKVVSGGSTITSPVNTNLSSNTTYYYRVRAHSTNSTSASSTPAISVTTCANAPVITGNYCTGETTVSGTSTDVDGTDIVIYNTGNVQIGTATVTDGLWTTTVSALASGDSLTATAQVGSGCLSTPSTAKAVNSPPTVSSISGAAFACSGVSGSIYSVTDTVGHTYEWTVIGGTFAPTTTNQISVTWGAAGEGTVDVTETVTASGCFASATQKTVTINDSPTVSIDGPTTIAIGGTTALSPTTDGTWVSNTPSIAAVTNEGIVTAGTTIGGTVNFTYTSDSTGCNATTDDVTVNALATFSAIVPDALSCTDVSSFQVSGLTPQVDTTIYYKINEGTEQSSTLNPNSSIGSLTISIPSSSNGQHLRVTKIKFTDYVSSEVTVADTENSNIILDFGLPVTSAISGSNSVCVGSTGVAYDVTDTAGSSYEWTITGGTQASGGTTSSITVDWGAAGSGNVSVVETNGVSCPGVAVNLAVTVNALTTSGSVTTSICDGDTYVWPANGTSYTTAQTNLIHTVGCNTATLNLTITPLSTPTTSLTSSDLDNTFAYGTTVTFTATAGSLGGGTANYDFKVNGVSVQNGASNTYVASTANANNLANGNQVSVVITVTGGTCLTSPTATSNTITNTVTGSYASAINTYCGLTMPAIDAVIRCTVPSDVVGTLAYRFKVKNNITATTVTYDSAVPNFKLTATSVYAYATSYDVQVAPLVNGLEQPFSAVCVITTPAIPLNQIGPCTQTLTSLSDRIYANYTIFGSQLYRFRVAESTAPTTYYYATSVGPNFRLTSVPGLPLNFGKTYLVSVQTDLTNNGIAVTSSYDAPCTVNTPAVTAVNVVANQCGEHLVTITDRIFVNAVPNAVSYNYRVKKGLAGTEYDFNSSYTNFRLSNVVGLSLTYASDYYVSVQSIIRIDGIDYPSNFSTPCIITTPDFPTVSLQASQCSDGNLENPGPYMVPTTGTPIYCDFVSGATYEFSLQEYDGENPVGDPLTSLVRPTNNFTLHQVAGVLPNKIYLVSVTLTSYGQGPIGHACVIQSPAAAREIAPVAGGNMKVEFSAVAYPNPFANNFVIDVKTRNESAVSLKVYDMIGRLVDQKSVNVSDLQASPIGDNYPSGVYNVIVTQGEDVRTLRVVKR